MFVILFLMDQLQDLVDKGNFTSDNLIAIIAIIIVSVIVWQFSLTIISNLIRRSLKPDRFKSRREEELRENTLISIANAVLKLGIILLAFLLILAQLGVNIGPMLAGAGIVGVALGFGFQSLVKDWVSGTFILMENQYRVGDVIELNQTVSGVVESMSLRQTVLRDLDGMVHHIPNGTIDIATNMTMEYANINLDIGVGYNTDMDKLEKVINEVGLEIQKDKDWRERRQNFL